MIDLSPMLRECTTLSELGSHPLELGIAGRWGGFKITFPLNRVMLYIKLKHITRRVQCNDNYGSVTPSGRNIAPWWWGIAQGYAMSCINCIIIISKFCICWKCRSDGQQSAVMPSVSSANFRHWWAIYYCTIARLLQWWTKYNESEVENSSLTTSY